jgi:uncharacterized tellurite resistance protein B-like protein
MAIDFGQPLTLPTNPNCVTFAASAAEVLAGKSWRDLQRRATVPLHQFFLASGISPTAYFGWRMARDRKNRNTAQITLQFVFDGPATAAHLARLESTVARDEMGWTSSSIERIPANSIPSLMVTSEGLFQLWHVLEHRTVAHHLHLTDHGIQLGETTQQAAVKSQFLDGARHAVYRRPTASEHNENLERMRLIFAEHFARRIMEADGVVRTDERQFMETVFPRMMLERMGLIDHAIRKEWYDQSLRELPTLLGHHDKLAMIGLFFSACYSDGSLDAREMRVLKEAGEMLGLTTSEVVDYLQRFW